jgi:hypothetical protein
MVEDERTKLKILLDHWIEHNKEHGEEFSQWAEKAKGFGEAKVHDDILEATQQMNRANEFLLKALHALK